MSFFPINEQAGGPPSLPAAAAAAAEESSSSPADADLLGIDDDGSGTEGDRATAAAPAPVPRVSEDGVGDDGDVLPAVAEAAADEGVVFEGLSLPGVVHEETRAVETENASVEASIKVRRRGSDLR